MNRKHNKRGFTLIEIIVVLVILAILAAILIPAMTGWIDKAREKRACVDLHTIALAGKSAYAEMYGVTPLDDYTSLQYANDAKYTALVDDYLNDATLSAGIDWLSATRLTLTILYHRDGYSYSYAQGYDGKVTINSWES